ncbi:SubName: Full=Uncharacterized protein {ECO:0000313/EMBL:CCA74157.1} [Serendipita indica DSM 11827]|nr:SubName: Full=Uncharacterized protein {ECO:0000313/EMBL:CCA74157.1} [Serendipita indica DSM 11827]
MSARPTSKIYSILKPKWLQERSSSKRYFANAQCAPIFRLPTEVLAEIFAFAVEGDEFRETPRPNQRVCETLSRTCSHFRAILLDMPAAWIVDISLDWSPSTLSKYLEIMLSRVSGSPLRVVLRDGHQSAKAALLRVLSEALRKAKIDRIESARLFLGRMDMAYFPQVFLDLLPVAPRSLTLHALASPPTRGIFKRTKRTSYKVFVIPPGPMISAVESIQVIDALLNIGVDVHSETPMALRSLKVLQTPEESMPAVRCGLIFGTFLGRCTHLETLVFHGRLFWWAPPFDTPSTSPLKELYIAEFDSDTILHSLSVATSFPSLTKFGVSGYKPSLLLPFLLSNPSISDLSLPYIAQGMRSSLRQITKLTISSKGLHTLFLMGEDDSRTFTALEELIIDCREKEASQIELETLIETRVTSPILHGYERPLSSISLLRPSTWGAPTSELSPYISPNSGHLTKDLIHGHSI